MPAEPRFNSYAPAARRLAQRRAAVFTSRPAASTRYTGAGFFLRRGSPPLARTSLCAAALLLAGLGVSRAGPAAKGVDFADDFRGDTLAEYERAGAVTWHKGGVPLGPSAALRRELPLGPTVEVEATVRWPRGQQDGSVLLALRTGTGEVSAGAVLGRLRLPRSLRGRPIAAPLPPV